MYQCIYVYDLSDPKSPLAGLSDSVVLPSPVNKLVKIKLKKIFMFIYLLY